MGSLGLVVLGGLIAHANGAEKPVALYAGLGVWHHSIATKNSEAQKYFDQGLTLAPFPWMMMLVKMIGVAVSPNGLCASRS